MAGRCPAIALCALLIAACGSDGGGTTEAAEEAQGLYIVGDSTMAQVVAHTDAVGSTQAGCGYTADAPCLIFVEDSFEADLVVAAVSYWDRNGSDQQIADGYRAYHERLSQVAPVVWIELPPNFIEGNDPTPEKADEFNNSVAQALGCSLAPWSAREGASYDGIHYVPPGRAQSGEDLDGPGEVWRKLSALGSEDACQAT